MIAHKTLYILCFLSQEPLHETVMAQKDAITFTGHCHCGSISYTSTSHPQNLTYCYCSTCRRLSGAPFIAWADIPVSSLLLEDENNKLKILSSGVAKREICSECGSPITMRYLCDEEIVGIAAAGVDEDSLVMGEGNELLVTEHIFVGQKRDGTRYLTMVSNSGIGFRRDLRRRSRDGRRHNLGSLGNSTVGKKSKYAS